MSGAQTVLAFDFGLRRIGIASGDTVSRSAAPRAAVPVGRRGPDWERIAREVSALEPGLLVVGIPYHADGSEGRLSPAVRRFAAELERRFALPVQLIDERYSSLEAAAQLKARRAGGERRRRVGRADIDSAAAAVILTRFLTGDEAL
jgi:putative Holliday junction resolvase